MNSIEMINPVGDPPGVLVVDDDRQVRILLQLGLERRGFSVWVASSGLQAVALFREHMDEIAFALLDVCMPGMDGPATMRILRGLNPAVPVFFMSGDTGRFQPAELEELGAECVFTKPFRMSELEERFHVFSNGTAGGVYAVDSRG
jgi:DNA-binding response OmpR family regulator